MSDLARLHELERQIREFPREEQLWLIERLARGLRSSTRLTPDERDQQLALMAADPDIQREIREIDKEFAHTERDGLE